MGFRSPSGRAVSHVAVFGGDGGGCVCRLSGLRMIQLPRPYGSFCEDKELHWLCAVLILLM